MNSKGKILVVDDDRLVLVTLTQGLAQAGYEVLDADNGDDAILIARQHKPILALLDIRMEGMSGFDVAAYLRDYCQIPFMFLSAFSDEATLKQVQELGAVAYLVKPLDIRQIVPAVDNAVGQVHAQRHARAAAVEESQGQASHAPTAGLAASQTMPQAVAMAIGVLMHRYSLSRLAALQRLQRQADAEKRLLVEQAEQVLQAVEALAKLGED
jgi:DNA-binding response OmpR family regulator